MIGQIVLLILLMSTFVQAGKYTYVPIPVDTWDVCNTTDRCAKAEDAVSDPVTWEVVADITADNVASFAQKSGTRDYESQIAMQLDTSCNYLWLRAKGSGVVWLRTTPFGPVPSNTTASILFNGAVATDWTWTPIGSRSDENLQRVLAGSTVPINDVAQRDFAFTPGTNLYILTEPSVQLDSWFCSTNANAIPVSPGGSAGVSTNYSLYQVTTEPTIDDAQWDRASVVPKTGFTTSPTADMEIRAVWKAGTPSRMCVRGEETLANLTWIDVSTDDSALGSYTAVFAYFKMNNLDRVLDVNTWLLGVSPQPDFYDATWPAGVFSTASDLTNIAVTQSTSGNRRRMQACFDAPAVITTGAQWLCDFRQNERITGGTLKYRSAFNTTSTVSAVSNWGVCAAGVMLPGPPVDNTPPSVGSVAFTNVTSTSFTVTATASDGETGISSCAVVYDTTNDNSVTFGVDPSVAGTISGGTCSATITGLTAGTAYEAAVYAVNGVGLFTTGAVGDQATVNNTSATFYVSPTGLAGAVCSNAAPCALSRLTSTVEPRPSPGETWILKNGTYAMTAGNAIALNCATGGNALNGTSLNPITIQAETERQAWLKGDGLAPSLSFTNCNYWQVNGLRISGRDNNLAGSTDSLVSLESSHHLTFTSNLLHHNNRYRNMSLMQNGTSTTTASNNNTFIKNEFYYFHRYGLISKYSTGTIARLNYCNARGFMDIPGTSGGYPSGVVEEGDACERSYPGSNTLTESNIAEQSGVGFSPEALVNAVDNRYFGNIHLNGVFGTVAIGKAGGQMPINLYYKDHLIVSPNSHGFYMRAGRNTKCEQCTVFGGLRAYTYENSTAQPGTAPRSMYLTNVLSVLPLQWGFYTNQVNLEAWGVNYMAVLGGLAGGSFNPPTSNLNITNSFSQPANQMGNCRVWVPESASFLKRQGLNGEDIGAEVLYEYVNEVKTNTKLWNRTTGAWIGAGATINGTNPPFSPTVLVTNADINTVTDSAADVGSRLNILASGCLPAGY